MNISCWLLLLSLAILSPVFARDLYIVKDGISPDHSLAVAVVPQKEGEYIDEADGTVYLVKNPSKQILQKLDSIDSTGGTWGVTTENVTCKWSPKGRFLGINVRVGRLMHDFVLYQIDSQKAKLVTLPDKTSNQKSEIYKFLGYSANPGEVITAWLSPWSFTTKEYGLYPKDDDVDFSRYGFPDFDGVIEKLFVFKKSRWILEDLRSPKKTNDD